MSNKVGFWTVFTIVVSAQIGSAVLAQPAYLAKYGLLSIAGLAIVAFGAMALALMFSKLSFWVPKTGGPHAFAQEAFGTTISFFTGWTYWIVSWVSSTTVVLAAVGYICPIIGVCNPIARMAIAILIIFLVTAINFRGIKFAGHAEIFLWLLKAIPLILIPIAALFFFDIKNFSISPEVSQLSTTAILGAAALKFLWGFVGLETATAAAGSVENASKTIPKAVILGTTFVALLYLLNTVGILGIIPGSKLALSPAPYTDAAQTIFGGSWYIAISIISFIILFGTLNAWVLTSGQISLGLSEDGLMPKIFGKKNKYDAPYWGLIFSFIGTGLLLLLTANSNPEAHIKTLEKFVSFSTVAFALVYTVCCLAFFKILFKKKDQVKSIIAPLFYGSASLVFCIWLIYNGSSLSDLLIACLFTLSGLPFYLKFGRKK